MAIKHSTTKAHGDKGLAVEWNDDHVIDAGTITINETDFANQSVLTTSDVVFDDCEVQTSTILDHLFLTPIAAAPAPAVEGMIYINSVTHHLMVYLSGAWVQLD